MSPFGSMLMAHGRHSEGERRGPSDGVGVAEQKTRLARAAVSCHATYRRLPDPHRTRTPRPPRATSRRTARQRQRLGSRRHRGGTRPRIPGRPRGAEETNPRRLETLQARGRLGRRSRRTRCRRARGGPARNPDQHRRQPGAAPGRPRPPRSSPATSSASSSATPAGRRGSRPARHAPRRRGEHSAPSTPGRTYGVTPRRFGRAVDASRRAGLGGADALAPIAAA